jgi:hypothetical protein
MGPYGWKSPQKEKRPGGAAMGTIAAFAVNFYYKDTAPSPYRYREVSTPIHIGAPPLRGPLPEKVGVWGVPG